MVSYYIRLLEQAWTRVDSLFSKVPV
uniref:Uncharacterized protein n=1 Tax=Lepeophtheirus salmonis TaxID=72036 RepID=A0A0K2THI6_LEPSM